MKNNLEICHTILQFIDNYRRSGLCWAEREMQILMLPLMLGICGGPMIAAVELTMRCA
jgi:hypothetical protein